jgi:hypothetical protein
MRARLMVNLAIVVIASGPLATAALARDAGGWSRGHCGGMRSFGGDMTGVAAGRVAGFGGDRAGGLDEDCINGLGTGPMADTDHDHVFMGRRHFPGGGGYHDDYGRDCAPYDALYSWPCD